MIEVKSCRGKVFKRNPTKKEIEAFKRQQDIFALRKSGLTYKKIGEIYNISPTRARQLYIKSLRECVWEN